MNKGVFTMNRVLIVPALIILTACGSEDQNVSEENTNPDYTLMPPEGISGYRVENAIHIEWDESEYATGYDVYYSTNGDFDVSDPDVWMQNTNTTEIEVPISSFKNNHFVIIQSTDGMVLSDSSDKEVFFSFLEVSGLEEEYLIDHLSDKEWKRCNEGQSWDLSSNSCLGVAASYSIEEAANLFEQEDINGWSMPLWGGAAGSNSYETYGCIKDETLATDLLNLSGCYDNREWPLRSSFESLANESFKESCKEYLIQNIPSLDFESFYLGKPPANCSTSRYYSKNLQSGSASLILAGQERVPTKILLNRSIN